METRLNEKLNARLKFFEKNYQLQTKSQTILQTKKSESVFKFTPSNRLGVIRDLTVIEVRGVGICFYRSSGTYSKNRGTWFVCRGVREDGWIRKCKVAKNGSFINYCKSNNISFEHLQSRLGRLDMICISASLGGGFWETKDGKGCKEFLFEKYPKYFLSKETVEKILINQRIQPLKIYITSVGVNEHLKKLGSSLPLYDDKNRLPTELEEIFFSQSKNNKKIQSALTMMLNINQKIDEKIFLSICELDKQNDLMNYCLKVNLFEDSEQVNALNKLMLSNNKINIFNLRAINKLESLYLSGEHNCLLKTTLSRRALRFIAEWNQAQKQWIFEEKELSLIKKLVDKKLLSLGMGLLKKPRTKLALQLLEKNKKIDRVNMRMIEHLFRNNMLYLSIKLFDHPDTFQMLTSAYKKNNLNRDEVKKINLHFEEESRLAEKLQALKNISYRYSNNLFSQSIITTPNAEPTHCRKLKRRM